MTTRFEGSFTRQSPLPPEALEAANRVLASGRLHRYDTDPGEMSEVAALEAEYAAYMGQPFCVAVGSGGAAMAIALRAAGVGPGAPVLTNAFTLAPVPGAIAAVGGRTVFVETTEDLTIDFAHLAQMARQSGARHLLLSHMRGHVCDMEALTRLACESGLTVIEDCAHTMGARWNGRKSGTFGLAGCFSTQTYKHMNSGEGGFLTTSDPALAAQAVHLSGSYMFHDRHGAAPGAEVFAPMGADTPNMSSRMDNLRAAILRPQLRHLDAACEGWNKLYRAVEDGLRGTPGIALIDRPAAEGFVGSSIQFRLPDHSPERIAALVARSADRGVVLKWFGAEHPKGFTAAYRHWGHAAPCPLPGTDRVLAGLLDMRLPLTFAEDDCRLIAAIIAEEVARG